MIIISNDDNINDIIIMGSVILFSSYVLAFSVKQGLQH